MLPVAPSCHRVCLSLAIMMVSKQHHNALQVEKGPSYLDAAVTYEPMVVEFNEANGTFLRNSYGDDFAFIFPAYVVY